MRVVAITCAALTLGCTVAGATTTSTSLTSGLRGVVIRGPIRPVCGPSDPCDAPAPGVVLRFKQRGRLIARVKSGTGGRYRVLLRPGRYAVSTPNPSPAMGLSPSVVRVPKGRVARVNFRLDTGIQ
jgi:hypothetical protein